MPIDESNSDLREEEFPDEADRTPAHAASVDLEPCPFCGKAIYEDADICHHCGSFIARDTSGIKPYWIVVIALILLAMVLGGFFLGF